MRREIFSIAEDGDALCADHCWLFLMTYSAKEGGQPTDYAYLFFISEGINDGLCILE
jgi:hypothetical protein